MIQFNLDVLISEYSYSELVNTKTMLKKMLDYSKILIDEVLQKNDTDELSIITEEMNNVFNNIRLVEEAISVKTIQTFETINLN
jgi:hypothetical protein